MTAGVPSPEERLHPLRELTLVRMREFLREPEAVFWVFAFPVIMTCALGVAFRSRADDPVIVGVERGVQSAALSSALERAGGFVIREVDAGGVDRALRDGRVQVVVVPGTPPTYRFDPARAESQVARLSVDAVLQQAAGRADAFTARQDAVRAVGSRYIDWLVPGLLGMNIMGTGMWSTSFAIVTARTRKLLKRLVATPMPRSHYLLSLLLSRLVFLTAEVVVLVAFAWIVFGVAVHGSLAAHRRGVRAAQPGDGADVGVLGRVLRLVEFPGRGPAAGPGAAADRAERRAAGGDERRRAATCDLERAGDPHGVGKRLVRRCASTVPVELKGPDPYTATSSRARSA
jgi:hypothetical protein